MTAQKLALRQSRATGSGDKEARMLRSREGGCAINLVACGTCVRPSRRPQSGHSVQSAPESASNVLSTEQENTWLAPASSSPLNDASGGLAGRSWVGQGWGHLPGPWGGHAAPRPRPDTRKLPRLPVLVVLRDPPPNHSFPALLTFNYSS